MTEKEQVIEELIKFPLSYALMWGFKNEKGWDEEKLKYLELNILKDYLRDAKTIEVNKKYWNGNN